MKETTRILKWTQNELDGWESGYAENAPHETKIILDEFDFKTLISLIDTLFFWLSKESFTNGELILAYVNLGSIIESFMKFFYVIYRDNSLDHSQYKYWKPNKYENRKAFIEKTKVSINDADEYRKNNVLDPDKLSFDDLIQHTRNVLDEDDIKIEVLESVRDKRNSIHSFHKKDLGSPNEFRNNTKEIVRFLNNLIYRLPDNSINEYY